MTLLVRVLAAVLLLLQVSLAWAVPHQPVQPAAIDATTTTTTAPPAATCTTVSATTTPAPDAAPEVRLRRPAPLPTADADLPPSSPDVALPDARGPPKAECVEAAGSIAARGATTVYRVEGAVNQRLLVDAAGNVSVQGRNMLFLNFGDAARAEQFVATRVAQGMEGATMRSFQVPTSFVDELAASAVPESMARQFPNAPLVVDVTKAANQFGLRPAQIEALERAIIQGSGR